MVGSYGLNGVVEAINQKMLFCENVDFKCCSFLDELKYHKYWNSYYLTKHEKSFELIEKIFKESKQIIQEFQGIDFDDLKEILDEETFIQAEELYEEIQSFNISEIDKLIGEVKNVEERDKLNKKQFICFLCDFKNHLIISELDKKIYQGEDQCKELIAGYKTYLKTKLLQFDPIILKINQFINLFELENQAFLFSEENEQIVENTLEQANKCLSGSFLLKNCQNLCGRYQFANISKVFIANIDLYQFTFKRINYFNNYIEGILEILAQNKENEQTEEKIQCEEDDAECLEKQKEETDQQQQDERKMLQKGRILFYQSKLFKKLNNIEKSLKKYKKIIKHKKKKKFFPKFYYSRYLNDLPQQQQQQTQQIQQPQQNPQQPQQNPQQPQQNPQQTQQNPQQTQLNPQQTQENPQQTQQNPQQTQEQEKQLTEEELKKQKEEELQKKKDEFIQELKLNQTKIIYEKFYHGYEKGSPEEFDHIDWIDNQFFEGDFLNEYNLGFHDLAPIMSYNFTETFNQDKAQIINETVYLQHEPLFSYEILPSANTTFDIIEYVNKYMKEDICDFNNDIDIIIGSLKPGDVIDYEEILNEIKQEQLKKKEEEKQDKLNSDNNKKNEGKEGEKEVDGEEEAEGEGEEGEGGEGEEGGGGGGGGEGGGDEEKEPEERLLKKLKKTKRRKFFKRHRHHRHHLKIQSILIQ